MTAFDRELLELAAKAAEIGELDFDNEQWGKYWVGGHGYWNPLTDDGDALRLAVTLHLHIEWWPLEDGGSVAACTDLIKHNEPWRDDPHAATRRAIVRVAAEIGRAMK